MKKILHYITYQTFPADTANSLQTISNLKYFVKNNYELNLYFPLREKNSSKELENIQKKYNFNEIIILKKLKFRQNSTQKLLQGEHQVFLELI